MSKEKKLIPELRFPEFVEDGEWELKQVDEYFDVCSSKRVLQKDWTSKGVPFYRTRELVSLSKNEPFGSEIYISERLYSELKEKYGVPSEGDFLVSGVGTLGICYQVKANDKFYFKDGNVLWFKLNGELNSTYFKFCFESEHIQNQINAQTSKSTVGTYTIQNAKKTEFWYPLKPKEQQKIVSCLSFFDELIAAYNEKLQALKDHKKGLLQNLFPQKGQKVPNYRFPDFKGDGEWEEKELGKVCNMQAGKFVKASEILEKQVDNTHSCYGGNGLRGFTRSFTHKGKYSLIGRQGAHCGNVTLADGQFHATEHAVVVTPEKGVNTDWLFHTLVLLNLNQYATGQAQPGLSVANLEKVELRIPKSEQEQQKIASCLSALDALVMAQAEKIEQLQQHKKGLMQGLFPKIENGRKQQTGA